MISKKIIISILCITLAVSVVNGCQQSPKVLSKSTSTNIMISSSEATVNSTQSGSSSEVSATDAELTDKNTSSNTLQPVPMASVAVTKITLNKSSASLNVGSTIQLKATISPSNAINKSVTWSSSDNTIVTVDSKGNVTAKKASTAYVYAASSNGKKASCKVTVTAPAKTSSSKSSTTSSSNPYANYTLYVETHNVDIYPPYSEETGAGTVITDLIEANTTASWDVQSFFYLSVRDYAQGVITLDQLKQKYANKYVVGQSSHEKFIVTAIYENHVSYTRDGNATSIKNQVLQAGLMSNTYSNNSIVEDEGFGTYGLDVKNGTAYRVTFILKKIS